MTGWELPVDVEIGGQSYAIRSDFRAVLDALAAFSDESLTDSEKLIVCLQIMIPKWKEIQDPEQAFRAVMEWVNLGKPIPENHPPKPKLVDWANDAELIAPAVDKVLGYSCRRCEYLHWWEFIGAFYNIGRGTFSEVVYIRSKLAKGKKLTKEEQAFVNDNPDMFGKTQRLTAEEEEFFKALGV